MVINGRVVFDTSKMVEKGLRPKGVKLGSIKLKSP